MLCNDNEDIPVDSRCSTDASCLEEARGYCDKDVNCLGIAWHALTIGFNRGLKICRSIQMSPDIATFGWRSILKLGMHTIFL